MRWRRDHAGTASSRPRRRAGRTPCGEAGVLFSLFDRFQIVRSVDEKIDLSEANRRKHLLPLSSCTANAPSGQRSSLRRISVSSLWGRIYPRTLNPAVCFAYAAGAGALPLAPGPARTAPKGLVPLESRSRLRAGLARSKTFLRASSPRQKDGGTKWQDRQNFRNVSIERRPAVRRGHPLRTRYLKSCNRRKRRFIL